MKMFLIRIIQGAVAGLVVGAILAFAGCSKDVSFDTLETARVTAKANGEYNAQTFRANHPEYANFALESQGDSSQAPDCPQGDGWVSAYLVDKANMTTRVALKCSSVSGAVGCLTQKDFQTKSYAGDDGHCQPVSKVPFPLPKVAK